MPEAFPSERVNSALHQHLKLIAQQNEEALAEFYDATLGKVYAIALYITGSQGDAEEVVEDVYLQVWQQAGRYDPDRARVMTWLQTICRSRALDYLRRNDNANTFTHPDPQSLNEHDQTAGAYPYHQVDSQTEPLDILTITESRTAIHKALRTLLPQQRQLVALAFFKDMSHRQIAEHTAIPLGTVKSHIRNAMITLQKSLASDGQRLAK